MRFYSTQHTVHFFHSAKMHHLFVINTELFTVSPPSHCSERSILPSKCINKPPYPYLPPFTSKRSPSQPPAANWLFALSAFPYFHNNTGAGTPSASPINPNKLFPHPSPNA